MCKCKVRYITALLFSITGTYVVVVVVVIMYQSSNANLVYKLQCKVTDPPPHFRDLLIHLPLA